MWDGGWWVMVRLMVMCDGDVWVCVWDENEVLMLMGSVCFVGVGLGGVDVLMMGAARAFANVDVVVYDDLGGFFEDVLVFVMKVNVEFVSVGKRGGLVKFWM